MKCTSPLALLFGLALPLVQQASAETLGPWRSFKTEPTFEASLLNITQKPSDPSLLSNDYLFFSLTTFSEGGPWGPQIFDSRGNLVFFNNLHEHTLAVGDPHVCDYDGSSRDHFCLGKLIGGVRGRWMAEQTIYDNTYRQIGRFGRAGGLGDADGHENNMISGGHSFIRLVYNPKQADLTPFAGAADGWVHDVCFQEIDVHEGTELFQWCYLERYPISDTYIYMNVPENKDNLTSGIAGKGTADEPWDFLHLNAVDKNSEGDYLVSARHLNQILKIAGPGNAHSLEPGTTIWRLGGKANEFTILGDKEVLFSKQHHVRYVSTGATESVFTLFDNAWEGSNDPTSPQSAGKIVKINNETMEASLLKEFPHPEGSLAMAQGSMVPLENGNYFVGWGWLPEFSEFSKDGEVLLHAKLAHDTKTPHLSAYRSYKFPWKAYPYWTPKLLIYSQTCKRSKSSPLMAYVSWNGATEIRRWRFYVTSGDSPRQAKWLKAGTYNKDGFETEVELHKFKSDEFIKYVSVEALDRNGAVLGATVSKTFVPDPKFSEEWGLKCGRKGCIKPEKFEYSEEYSQADMCFTSDPDDHGFIALLILFVVFEGLAYWWSYPIELLLARNSWAADLEKVPTIMLEQQGAGARQM